jgi:deazaflavin-dependent oxidoreductase (nitroreductase family)
VALDPNSTIGRAVQAMAGSRLFARIGPTIVPPLDRLVHRLSGGRLMLSRGMLPCAIVTTIGRRTGQRRETPLAAVPLDGDVYVVGSNFGKPYHPAWSGNLIADPHATVSFAGEQYPAVAHLLDPDEKAETWPRLIEQWPLFDQYVSSSGRDLRVFRLRRQ